MLRRAVPDLVTGDTPWLGMRHCDDDVHGRGRHAAEEGRGPWGPERRSVARRDTKGEVRSGVGSKKSERVKMGTAAGRIRGEAVCS